MKILTMVDVEKAGDAYEAILHGEEEFTGTMTELMNDIMDYIDTLKSGGISDEQLYSQAEFAYGLESWVVDMFVAKWEKDTNAEKADES